MRFSRPQTHAPCDLQGPLSTLRPKVAAEKPWEALSSPLPSLPPRPRSGRAVYDVSVNHRRAVTGAAWLAGRQDP